MATTNHARVLDRDSSVAFTAFLLGEARDKFTLAAAGRLYAGPIERAADAVHAAPAAAAPDVEREEALRSECELHTAKARTLWMGLETLGSDPDVDGATQAAAGRVLDALGKRPTRRTAASARYTQSVTVLGKLPALRADLALLPVAAGGAGFEALITRWCEVGKGLTDDLVAEVMRERAPPKEAVQVMVLVQRLNGLINRARAALRDEVGDDARLPRSLEDEVFGLYDTMLGDLRTKASRAKEPAVPGPAAPVAEPVPAAELERLVA